MTETSNSRGEKRKEIVAFRVSKHELEVLQRQAQHDSDLSSYLRKIALGENKNESGNIRNWERITPKRCRTKNSPELAQVTEMVTAESYYGGFF